MITRIGITVLLIISLTAFKSVFSQQKTDDIIGIWELEDKTSKLEIYKEDGKYFGKLLYGSLMVNEDGSNKKDVNNPNPELRDRDIIGSTYVFDLEFDKDEWNNGKVYDSNSGKMYACYVKIIDGNLHFTGYMRLRMLGQTYEYFRVN
jgi:uncharacterized protein (DUF2147 family)